MPCGSRLQDCRKWKKKFFLFLIILKVTIPVANIDIYHRILQKEATCMCFNIHTGIWHESIVTLAIGTFLVFVTSVEWLLFLTSNMIRLFKSPIFQKLIWMHILWYQLYWVWSPTCHCLAVWGSLHCRCSRLTSNEWLLLNFSYLVSELFFDFLINLYLDPPQFIHSHLCFQEESITMGQTFSSHTM